MPTFYTCNLTPWLYVTFTILIQLSLLKAAICTNGITPGNSKLQQILLSLIPFVPIHWLTNSDFLLNLFWEYLQDEYISLHINKSLTSTYRLLMMMPKWHNVYCIMTVQAPSFHSCITTLHTSTQRVEFASYFIFHCVTPSWSLFT